MRAGLFSGFWFGVIRNLLSIYIVYNQCGDNNGTTTNGFPHLQAPRYRPCCICFVIATLLLKGDKLLSLSSLRNGPPWLRADSCVNLSPPPLLSAPPPRPRNPPCPRPPWRGAKSSSSRIRSCLERSRGDMLRLGGALAGLSASWLRLRDRLRLGLLL